MTGAAAGTGPEAVGAAGSRPAGSALSRAGIRFLEFVERNPECLDPASFEELRGNVDLAPYPLQPWPTFVEEAIAAAAGALNVRLCELARSLPTRVFDNDPARLATYFRLDPRYAALVSTLLRRQGYVDGLVARGDYIRTAAGFRCTELNFGGNLGGWQAPVWVSMYERLPLFRRFVQETGLSYAHRPSLHLFFAHVLYRARRSGTLAGGAFRVASLVPREYRSGLASAEYAERVLRAVLDELAPEVEGEVVVCENADLAVRPDGLYFDGRRIHAVSEQTFTRGGGQVVRALLAGTLDVYNGPATDVLDDKRTLALLSEHQDSDLFDRDERATIAASVPWTRVVADRATTWEAERARLPEILAASRERLVLKPATATQGMGVRIGRWLSPDAWRAAVAGALSSADPWIVQEYVESLPSLYLNAQRGCCEHDVVWGLFCFGRSHGGGFLRVMPKEGSAGIVNSARGATEGVILEVEE